MKYTFRPNWWMTLATLAVMALCIKAGLWQFDRAAQKQALQTQLNARLIEPPVALTDNLLAGKITDLESWRYRRVKLAGVYDTRYQVLLDNQVENTVAGYHVLTPMQVEGSSHFVLVNRGWIPKAAAQKGLQQQVPVVIAPQGRQEIIGDINIPAANFFTLEAPPPVDEKWQPIWQNLDLKRYIKSVPFEAEPYLVRLDEKNVGGFVRNWPPPGERVNMHLGYAYQWFGFALTLLVIYIVLNVKKVRT